MGDVGHAYVMRHDDDRLLELLVEATEQVEDLLSGLRVELPGGLVRQEERRGIREGPSNGDPLLLAPPPLAGTGARTLRATHPVAGLLSARRPELGGLHRQDQHTSARC